MQKQIPLIYFYGVERSQYQPVWPVFIVAEDVQNHVFKVAADAIESVIENRLKTGEFIAKDIDADLRRRYITTQVRLRLHQTAFREIHHVAFDSYFIGITPDYTIEVREDVRKESDGPMLLHGLQEMHSRTLILPGCRSDWPDQVLLIRKYEEFKKAG